MTLREKMRKSCLGYCKALHLFDPYIAGDLISGLVTLDSTIDLVVYTNGDKLAVGEALRANYDNLSLDDQELDSYRIAMFPDIYGTHQTVRITVTGKDPAERNKDLVVNWKDYFGPVEVEEEDFGKKEDQFS